MLLTIIVLVGDTIAAGISSVVVVVVVVVVFVVVVVVFANAIDAVDMSILS